MGYEHEVVLGIALFEVKKRRKIPQNHCRLVWSNTGVVGAVVLCCSGGCWSKLLFVVWSIRWETNKSFDNIIF